MRKIPVYEPDLTGNEIKYATDALTSGWISSLGQYIDRFEAALAQSVETDHAIALSNGTVALHLALHCLGIGPGDEVIVPTFTYIASVNTIAQTGATPVFADVRASDWLLDINDIEHRITPRTKAIMPVHLYGAVCDPAINDLARRHGLYVIEDCAEALGSSINGRPVGKDADVATFSFFGNKTITTGEGGAVTASDPALASRMRKVKGQGQSLTKRYWHDEIGFNYRMTNICAAIGVAQFERLPNILEKKRAIAKVYREQLKDSGLTFQVPLEGVVSSEWLVSLLLPVGLDRDQVMAEMSSLGFDTRPVFYCAHHMPMYASPEKFPVSEDIAMRGISLPSYPTLEESDVVRICAALRTVTESGAGQASKTSLSEAR
ncbi:DegT/DnrJ/EryC1/StrS family aminotransferase [Sphingomonas sp. AAP5]|uniref:DegT/DnrJ/EryC1/StrS family aminotransferase n=1 Tax=Sphingomonas sp. AAP5 TaxID=1523415 RepID=UPI0010570130|nr:DegT/DnrJ/EryC1/StrS family aminotransferase [Sphingomonas sp. AAP5]QBM76841.1 DegT/DnrJ/EryC1/StrS family aminotransferase [Sphingomonas sp. AAP5]